MFNFLSRALAILQLAFAQHDSAEGKPPHPRPLPQSTECVFWGRGEPMLGSTQGAPAAHAAGGTLGYDLTPRCGFLRRKRPPAASQIVRRRS